MTAQTLSKHKFSARKVALEILYLLEQKDLFAEECLQEFSFRHKLSPQDRRLAAELVFGTTKMKKRLDYVLSFLVEDGLERLTAWIRSILRMGIYQLDFTDKIPDYAAVDESVNLARQYGHAGVAGLVNAVLRNYLRHKEQVKFPEESVEYLSTFYSFPEWLIERWLSRFCRENVIQLCEYFNRKPSLGFRVDSLKADSEEVEGYFQQKSLTLRKGQFADRFYYLESPVELGQLKLLQQGKIYIQDESSLLAVELLDPQPGQTILDLCAAPGGKTGYIAQKMKNQGKVIAVDKSEVKLKLVKENCERLGIKIVETALGDAVKFKTEPVDKILVDAPCSGTGVLNRNADARWRKKPEDLPRLAKLQLAILKNAAALLKKGGVMVYSTCSIMPEENQMVVEKFVKSHPEVKVVAAGEFVPAQLVTPQGYLQSLPFVHNIDGAFAVRLKNK